MVPFENIVLTALIATYYELQMLAGTSFSATVKNCIACVILSSAVICGCVRYLCKYSAVSVIINAFVFPSISYIHLLCWGAGPTLNPSLPIWSQDFLVFDVLWIIILHPRGTKGVSL